MLAVHSRLKLRSKEVLNLKTYIVEVSQNGWEYTGFVFIECSQLVKDLSNSRIIYADGVKIKFGEEVGNIREKQ